MVGLPASRCVVPTVLEDLRQRDPVLPARRVAKVVLEIVPAPSKKSVDRKGDRFKRKIWRSRYTRVVSGRLPDLRNYRGQPDVLKGMWPRVGWGMGVDGHE